MEKEHGSIYTTIQKTDASGDFLCDWELKPGLCNNLEAWEWEGGDVYTPMANSC